MSTGNCSTTDAVLSLYNIAQHRAAFDSLRHMALWSFLYLWSFRKTLPHLITESKMAEDNGCSLDMNLPVSFYLGGMMEEFILDSLDLQ